MRKRALVTAKTGLVTRENMDGTSRYQRVSGRKPVTLPSMTGSTRSIRTKWLTIVDEYDQIDKFRTKTPFFRPIRTIHR